MIFACPTCGRVTSSSMSMESGGYWRKYSRGGPWGCVSCGHRLSVRCQEPMCGAVGTPETIPNGYCDQCQTSTCAHCRKETDRHVLVGKLCPACLRLEVQCTCPYCGAVGRFPCQNQGQEAACTKCHATLIVPGLHQDSLTPGQKVSFGGTYRCKRCGPEGEGADIVQDHEGGQAGKSDNPLIAMMKTIMGSQVIDEARRVAAMPLALKTVAKGESLPECPNGCGERTHWELMNPAAKGASLVGEPRPVRECSVDANDRAAAVVKAAALGIQQQQILAIKLTRREKTGSIEGRDATLDGALQKAKEKLPAEAIMVGGPNIRQEPGSGQIEASASTEEKARRKLIDLRPSGTTMSEPTCGRKPVRLCRILFRKGTWSATWSRDCLLEVKYRIPGQFVIRALVD